MGEIHAREYGKGLLFLELHRLLHHWWPINDVSDNIKAKSYLRTLKRQKFKQHHGYHPIFHSCNAKLIAIILARKKEDKTVTNHGTKVIT